MATTSSRTGKIVVALIAGSCGLLAVAYPDWRAEAQAQTYTLINFNDRASLLSLDPKWDAARFTFADEYQEDGMIFKDGVVPPDPALGGARYGHYHLSYEDTDAFERILGGDRTIDPANQPRLLQPHAGDHVIQMTYDPNGDGLPDPFNLISIEVLSGELNVGVRGPFGIAVYNNLTAGFNWFLIGASNLTRATLEGTGSVFSVDNIVFQPSGTARVAGVNFVDARDALDNILTGELEFVGLTEQRPDLLTPKLHDFLHFAFVRSIAVDIVPGVCLAVLGSDLSDGTLIAAILGSADFDVVDVDPDTVLLAGCGKRIVTDG